jgi:hypothetical protein
MLTYWTEKLDFLTIETTVIFLRNIGKFEKDIVKVLTSLGYVDLQVDALGFNFHPKTLARDLKPLWFIGGPFSQQFYKGSLLTLAIDRAMLCTCENDLTFVSSVADYCKGFCD